MDISLHLVKNYGEPIFQVEYSHIIGSLMYVMNCTRPDIAYTVNKLSRFTSNPEKDHWKAIVRVLKIYSKLWFALYKVPCGTRRL